MNRSEAALFGRGDTDAIFSFSEGFIQLLVDDQFDAALQLLSGSAYTGAELREAIGNYFEDGAFRVVTDPTTAINMLPNPKGSYREDEILVVEHEKFPFGLTYHEDPDGLNPAFLDLDLPLNGSWEDQLTIKFSFEQCDGQSTLHLENIEVL